MIGVWVGVEHPFDGQPLLAHIVEDKIGVAGRGRTSARVKIQDWIDDRGRLSSVVDGNILEATSAFVMERRNGHTIVLILYHVFVLSLR
ncbi:hypothetical protein SPHINGOT1_300014 [Sphingomonas sp. T1]|nr:hypothetical protein SPHINGOT1_300014 [Sphingomonas sp. T1]